MIVRFIADLRNRLAYRFWLILGLAGITALLEGMAAAMLIPLFRVVGVGAADVGLNSVELALQRLLALFGLELALGPVLAVFFVAVVVQVGSYLLFQRVCAGAQTRYVTSWVNQLFEEVLAADWTFAAARNRGELISIIASDIPNRVGLAITGVVNMAGIGCFILVYICLALVLTWQLTLLLLVCGGLIALSMRPLSRHGETIGRNLQKADASLTTAVAEFISAFKTLKLSHTEYRAREIVTQAAAQRGGLYFRYLFDPAVGRAIIDLLAPMILAATLVAGTLLLGVDAAVILVLVGIFARLYPRISTFQQNWQSLRMLAPTADAMLSLSEAARQRREAIPQTAGDERRLAADGPLAVSFRNVDVAYGDKTVLRDISFDVAPGEVVALVGVSGAGKSTIVDALMRLLPLQAGSVAVNDVSLQDLSLDWWRQTVAYVAQDNVLFRGTIRENIAWGAGQLDDGAILQASQAAFAHEFIAALPQGYETPIGESGLGLSGGQRQRIAIARSMARNAPLLILDEATSALDSDSEAKITAALHALRGKTTIIMVAHRFSTIRFADRILVVQDGRIVQSGKWDQLMAVDGPFKALLDQQVL